MPACFQAPSVLNVLVIHLKVWEHPSPSQLLLYPTLPSARRLPSPQPLPSLYPAITALSLPLALAVLYAPPLSFLLPLLFFLAGHVQSAPFPLCRLSLTVRALTTKWSGHTGSCFPVPLYTVSKTRLISDLSQQ